MPSTSKKQHNFMAAVAHSPKFAKKVGVPQSVGKEFSNADKGKSFRPSGRPPSINKQKTNHGVNAMPNASLNKYVGHKDGGMTKENDMKHEDIKMDKKMAKKAIGMHDKQMHGGKKTDLSALKKGGCAKMARGGGIEVRGKTRGKMC